MGAMSRLQDAVSNLVARESAYDVPDVCMRYGLENAGNDDPFRGKSRYVKTLLKGLTDEKLTEISQRIVADYSERDGFAGDRDNVIEALELLAGPPRISEITRRQLAIALDDIGFCELGGKRGIFALLERCIPSVDLSFGGYADSFGDELHQHMVKNHDWSLDLLFERVGLLECSDRRFLRVMEGVVDPLARTGEEQAHFVGVINEHIGRDCYMLVEAGRTSGYPVYLAKHTVQGVAGRPKNLIFASTGMKPEIILRDAINNDVEVVRYGDKCLIYDEPFPEKVLTWRHLVSWWARQQGMVPGQIAAKSLRDRLCESVRMSTSPPERLLFDSYWALLTEIGATIPALLPQVYLHYDPLTARMLGGATRLVRQRMDFLMLLSHHERIVIEVDGKQHYAEGDRACPKRYAETVSEDRYLRLCGYEVYRFAGVELQGCGGSALVRKFFQALFEKYGLL